VVQAWDRARSFGSDVAARGDSRTGSVECAIECGNVPSSLTHGDARRDHLLRPLRTVKGAATMRGGDDDHRVRVLERGGVGEAVALPLQPRPGTHIVSM